MHVPVPIRAAVLVIALLSLFWLPWTVSLVLMFLSGLIFPPSAFALGILADLLYYPGHGFPQATFEGLALTFISIAVRHFVKTRIM